MRRPLVALLVIAYVLIGTGAAGALHRWSHEDGSACCTEQVLRHCGQAGEQQCDEGEPPAHPQHHDCTDCWICIHLASTVGTAESASNTPSGLELIAIVALTAPHTPPAPLPPAEVAARPPPGTSC